MRRSSLAATALWVLVSAPACGDHVTEPGSDNLSIETDKPEYSLGTDSTVHITVTNHLGQSVYIPMGTYVIVERLIDGEWSEGLAWFTVDGVGLSFPLEGGTSRTDWFEVMFYLDKPGTYRFQYWIYADPKLRVLLSQEERVSAPFTITR